MNRNLNDAALDELREYLRANLSLNLVDRVRGASPNIRRLELRLGDEIISRVDIDVTQSQETGYY